MRRAEGFILGVIALAMLVALLCLARDCVRKSDCEARGGTFVRTMTGFECIDSIPRRTR